MTKTSRSRRPVAVAWCAIVLGTLVGLSGAPQLPSREVLLGRAAAYLDTYGDAVSGIVGEENYLQEVAADPRARLPGSSEVERRLMSDIVFLSDPHEGWIEFRDVQTVNGTTVRQQERVIELLTKPHPSAVLQAQRIVELGARHNLNLPAGAVIDRTINLPMSALLFLKRAHQPRSTFTLGQIERIDGVNTLAVLFEEQATPRLIGSNSGAPATGQFWIEPETGAVIQSELKFSSGTRSDQTRATIRVRYARSARLKLALPSWMDEEYATFINGTPVSLACRATYSSYRRFEVVVDEAVAKPPEK